MYMYMYICVYTYWRLGSSSSKQEAISEIERVSLQLQSTKTFQSCRLHGARPVLVHSNSPSCRLQSTSGAECRLPYRIILDG